MKKVMVIGAGMLQTFLIKRAREMGYSTVSVDMDENAEGFHYSDFYRPISIIDQQACLEYAEYMKVDGVLTAATEYGVLTASYIANQLHLPGLDYQAATNVKNKYCVRKVLCQNKIDDFNQFLEIANPNDIEQIKNNIDYPVMVKPCDGSGSKAAKRVDRVTDLEMACLEAMSASLIGKALIEDFIQGKEYGVESFVYNGQIQVLGIIGKHMTSPPYYSELGHYYPCRLAIENKLRNVVINSIKALNINFGAVNMDVLITEDGKVYIIDIGARMGGNLIGSHIIPLGTGMDYLGNLIKAAVGDEIDLRPKNMGVNTVTRILALTPGRVTELPDFGEIEKQCEVEIYHHLKIGDVIREYHNNLDGCGYIVTAGGNIVDAERRAERAKELIDIGIIRV